MPRLFYRPGAADKLPQAFLCLTVQRIIDSGEKGRGDYRGEGIRGNYRLYIDLEQGKRENYSFPAASLLILPAMPSRTAPGASISPPISLHHETGKTLASGHAAIYDSIHHRPI